MKSFEQPQRDPNPNERISMDISDFRKQYKKETGSTISEHRESAKKSDQIKHARRIIEEAASGQKIDIDINDVKEAAGLPAANKPKKKWYKFWQ